MTVSRLLGSILCAVLLFSYAMPTIAQEETSSYEKLNKAKSDMLDDSEDLNTISAPSAHAFEGGEDENLEDETFFDAENLVPQGEMAQSGPRKVNPNTQPASKLVTVRKNHTADTKEAHLVSAERAMTLGRFDSALELFDVLYEKNRKDARVLMGRAVALQKLLRFDEAMGMYEELSKVQPENVEARVNMLGLLATRYPSVALRRLLDLHDANKSNSGLTAQIGLTYARSGNLMAAVKYLGMASSIDPRNANYMYNLAIIVDRAGDKIKAISYYERALEIDTVYGSSRSIPREAVYERLAQIR